MEKEEMIIKLKNGDCYYGWLRQLNNLLDEKNLLTAEGELLTDKSDATIAKKQRILVTKGIHPELLQNLPSDVIEAKDLLDYLAAQFGSVNHLTYLSELTELKQGSLDPVPYLQKFDSTLANYRNSGGKMDYDIVILYLLKGLDPWYAPYSGPRLTKMRTSTLDRAFYNATRNGILVHFADTPKPTGYKAMGAVTEKHCQKCVDLGRSERAIGSHNIAEHRDFPSRNEKVNSNKQDKEYIYLQSTQPKVIKKNQLNTGPVYDTAANAHFFKTKPNRGRKK